jgi:transcriptional/translational regulatory protein YebC/TACO1
VTCAPADFQPVKTALEGAGLKPEIAGITMRASTDTELSGDDGARMQKLLDALESLDDVQEIYTNAVIS